MIEFDKNDPNKYEQHMRKSTILKQEIETNWNNWLLSGAFEPLHLKATVWQHVAKKIIRRDIAREGSLVVQAPRRRGGIFLLVEDDVRCTTAAA